MPRRGPYKRYETDLTVPVPRQTVHNRRKRHISSETESQSETELIQEPGPDDPWPNSIHEVRWGVK